MNEITLIALMVFLFSLYKIHEIENRESPGVHTK